MKKLLSLLLVLVTLFILCGCEEKTTGSVTEDENAVTQEIAEEENASEKPIEEDPAEDEATAVNEETAAAEETLAATEESAVAQEVVPIIHEEETGQETEIETEPSNIVVYRTETGSKYHREGCRHLKSKIETTVEEALAIGLDPCSVCSPPQ